MREEQEKKMQERTKESLAEKKKKCEDVRREIQRVREQDEIALKKRTLKIESEDRARKLKREL